jgi:hypothetical protein
MGVVVVASYYPLTSGIMGPRVRGDDVDRDIA